jgi:predicted nucleic acid-binding protein
LRTRPRILLDTNVFVFGLERPKSNSAIILKETSKGAFEVVITERVFRETIMYFRRNYSKKTVEKVRLFLAAGSTVIPESLVITELRRWKGKIKEKDLENLAAVKALGIRHLVSLDRHYDAFPEHVSPRRFVESIGLKPSETEY